MFIKLKKIWSLIDVRGIAVKYTIINDFTMSRILIIFLCLTLIGSLGACNYPSTGAAMGTLNATNMYQTVAANLTQTVIFTTMVPPSGKTPTPFPTQKITQDATIARSTVQGTVVPEATDAPLACDQAAAGHPIDVTISDGTHMKPGGVFSKTWRLENVGSCTWTTDYAAVWFSGVQMGSTTEKLFTGPVEPGQTVDITIDMVAPDQVGTYQSNWKLRNSQGALFGIGPGGNAPFWAQIEVVAEKTPTPTENPTAVPTLKELVSGVILMEPDDQLDLDIGMLNSDQENDIIYQINPDKQPVVAPINGARIVLIGMQAPEQSDCDSKTPDVKPVVLTDLVDGQYICYWTGHDLPGNAHLLATDSVTSNLTVEYTTWSIP
jgi:hypothetical protein